MRCARSTGSEHLLITIDQEGGRVQRMKEPEWLRYPSGEVFDRLYELAPATAIEAARANAEALGLDLAEVGITCTHAPLLDVRQPDADNVIGDRAFGSEPLRVAALGRAVLDGLARAGVAGTIKHMPGHGRTSVDTPQGAADRDRQRRRARMGHCPVPRAQPRCHRHDRASGFHRLGRGASRHAVALRDRGDHPQADRL